MKNTLIQMLIMSYKELLGHGIVRHTTLIVPITLTVKNTSCEKCFKDNKPF